MGELLAYLWLWLRPRTKKRVAPNKLFDINDLSLLRSEVFKMARFDQLWFPRLFEPTSLGIRSWEYGVLIQNVRFRGEKVLDLGVGSSLLPFYLAQLGAKVTALDLALPMEKSHVNFVAGDMTKTRFEDNSFGVVLNISAMEHLDADYPKNRPVSRATFLNRTKKTIAEMVRVCQPGGLIFVTTDFFLPLQKTDKWKTAVKYKGIGGAYKASDLTTFLVEFNKLNCKTVGKTDFDFEKLTKDRNRANYRGRYITTVNFLFEKGKG